MNTKLKIKWNKERVCVCVCHEGTGQLLPHLPEQLKSHICSAFRTGAMDVCALQLEGVHATLTAVISEL